MTLTPTPANAATRDTRRAPIGLGAVFAAWLTVCFAAAVIGAATVSLWLVILGPVAALGGVLAVAAVTAPPRPLSEVSILAQSSVWLGRAAWATLVLAAGSVFSSVVALDLADPRKDPEAFNRTIHDSLQGFVWPIAAAATFLAVSSIPFKLWRVGPDARTNSVGRLVERSRAHGVAAAILDRVLFELVAMPTSLVVCYLGPAAVFALLQAGPALGLER